MRVIQVCVDMISSAGADAYEMILMDVQLRLAVYGVGTGTMTIDEAVAGFGTYGQ